MNIIFFTHPSFLNHQSMPRFAKMLSEGMKKRGHQVAHWSPQAKFFNYPAPSSFKKWLSYVDQYILFPNEVRKGSKAKNADTLFVFTDQALGPWVPLVQNRPHVIHCHDFLAQLSALGEIADNPTSWTGKQYQKLIRSGYTKGSNFISVSHQTKKDLHKFLPVAPSLSEVVYNGLNRSFSPEKPSEMRKVLQRNIQITVDEGYILHIGGNQWYKNRLGVIAIYNAWRSKYNRKLPLLLIGETPNGNLKKMYDESPFQNDIHFLTGISDEYVKIAYSGATVFLFPSLAEGFGWPIAEAMASGCPVVTTSAAPMTEVAGDAAFLISKQPGLRADNGKWATEAAEVLNNVVKLTPEQRIHYRNKGIVNARRFDQNKALDRIEQIYAKVLSKENVI